MSKLESLKITEAPAAFASFAAKHNALVDIIAAIEGANGIKVTVSEKNARIEFDRTAALTVASLTTTGAVTVGTTLSVTGAATVGGNLTVTGSSTFSSGVTFSSSLTVSGTATFNGQLWKGASEMTTAAYDVCSGGIATSVTFFKQA